MKLNTKTMTVQLPSGFGMPACGHASVTSPAGFALTTTAVVRERQAAIVSTDDVKADMGLAYVPGTSAWSPPIS